MNAINTNTRGIRGKEMEQEGMKYKQSVTKRGNYLDSKKWVHDFRVSLY